MKKRFVLALILVFSLVGCGNSQPTEIVEEDLLLDEALMEEEPGDYVAENPAPELIEIPETAYANAPLATLYITTNGTNYTEYPMSYSGDLTAEYLISEMAFITGWNLDLADEVTSGAGGMTVSFADTSSLFVGPPEPQKDNFFCYDTYQLVESILNSIQYTLQQNFVDSELGDPETLDIYFCSEGDVDVYIPQIDVTVSMYEPYDGSLMD